MALWPTCGQSGYSTPTVLGVSNTRRGDKKQKCLSGPHVGKVAPSPLPSWGYPTLSAGPTIRNGYVVRMWAKWLHSPVPSWGPPCSAAGQKLDMATLAHMWTKSLHHTCRLGGSQFLVQGQKPELAKWPTCGQTGYITPTVLGVPNPQRGYKNEKWLCGPYVG